MRAFGLTKVVGFYGVMLGVALLAIWLRGDFAILLPGPSVRAWLESIGLGLATGAVVVLLSRGLVARYDWASRLAAELRVTIGELNAREAAIMAALSGVGEEVLFRGVLQPAVGIVIAALVFGLLHIGPTRSFLPWTIMAIAAGFAFGLMLLWTGNVLAPVLAHITINFINLRLIAGEETHVEVHVGPAGGERIVKS